MFSCPVYSHVDENDKTVFIRVNKMSLELVMITKFKFQSIQ